MTYKYEIPELDAGPYTIRYPRAAAGIVAEACASDFHYAHDGWECKTWPLDFVILDERNNALGTFSVDREVKPVFRAMKVFP